MFIAALSLSAALGFTQKAEPEVHDYKQAWTKITHDIEARYYNIKARQSAIDGWIKEAGPEVEAAKTDAQFDAAVEKFIHKFGDSHFDCYTPEEQGYYLFDSLSKGDKAKPMPNCGAYFFPDSNGWLVGFVVNGTTGSDAGIRQGDIIQTANDQPFQPVVSFQGQEGKQVTLKGLRDGKPITFTVTPSDDRPLDQFLEGTRESAKVINVGGLKIGYIHLWTQANPSFAAALQAAVLGSLYNTDAMILDDRSGYGGRPEQYPNPFFLPAVDFKWQGSRFGYTQHLGYNKPLVLLTDKYSRSAKEMFSDVMKISGRAVLVGQTTAGNVLGTSPDYIAPWCWLEMPIINVFVDGKRLEGVGVSPNIPVPAGFDAKGNDITLQAGIKEAEKLVQEAKKAKQGKGS